MKILSLFSGAGGIDIGFKQAGFHTALATDNWDIACDTLIKNNISKKVINDDIRNLDFNQISKNGIDIIVGGPPCPAYSKSRFYLKNKKRALEDENAFTLLSYFKAIKVINPIIFFFENVNGFVFKPHIAAFNYLKDQSEKLGYNISYKVINSANYGIPQIRQRFICVGFKKNLGKFIFPEETHCDPEKKNDLFLKRWVNCEETIGDLDFISKTDNKKIPGSKHSHLLKKIPPGDNYLFFTKERGCKKPLFKWRSRYWSFLLKLSKKKPSWTIQANFSNNMGPFHWKNRFLKISEIKRIQTFPDGYKLCGDFNQQWRQIGNAVPPLLAKIIAQSIKKQIKF